MESIINKPPIPKHNPKTASKTTSPRQEPYIPHPLPRIGQPEE
tara:strand:+ start:477 stop:605 length:129 start_codon:yes stop_codon:yes gene_type:complete